VAQGARRAALGALFGGLIMRLNALIYLTRWRLYINGAGVIYYRAQFAALGARNAAHGQGRDHQKKSNEKRPWGRDRVSDREGKAFPGAEKSCRCVLPGARGAARGLFS